MEVECYVCVKVRLCGWEESGLLNGVKKQHSASTGQLENKVGTLF